MVPEAMDGIGGSSVEHQQKMSASVTASSVSVSAAVSSSSALRQQLQQAQRALKRTQQHLQLQEARSRQLVSACAAKLRERQAETERAEELKERQFQRILQQLTVLQSRMQREQKQITARLQDQEARGQQQAREVERLRRTNRRLLTKVHRLSQPCARCGAKPDSGISDCDDGDEVAAKVARREVVTATMAGPLPELPLPATMPVSPVAVPVSPTTRVTAPAAPTTRVTAPAASPAGAAPKSVSGGSPPAERGIIRTPGEPRPAMHKTVTFSLQDKENVPEASPRRPARPARPRPPPPSVFIQPCIISPPSVSINGTTYGGQPSIVDTISQLLGADLEWPVVRRPTLVPKKLSVIPEGNESSRDELSEPEYENVRVETPGQDADREDVPTTPTQKDAGKAAKTEKTNGKECLDNDDVQNKNYRNVPRSRSNINLIMSESEGVQIKDNFEEFKFDDDMASSVCSETASERSADNGNDEKQSFDRRAGDGAESEQTDVKVVVNGNYEKFLELSGLSQKALSIPTSRFTSHRLMQKGKDAKHRQRIRMMFDGTVIEERSPTSSVRYYSEQL